MTQNHELDSPRYTIREVTEAAGISVSALDHWKRRLDTTKLLGGADEPGARGRGRVAQYTLRTAVRIALVAEATQYGVSPEAALLSAALFTSTGDEERNPCEPFKDGDTFLVFTDFKSPGRLLNITSENPRVISAERASAIVIDCEMVKIRTEQYLSRISNRVSP